MEFFLILYLTVHDAKIQFIKPNLHACKFGLINEYKSILLLPRYHQLSLTSYFDAGVFANSAFLPRSYLFPFCLWSFSSVPVTARIIMQQPATRVLSLLWVHSNGTHRHCSTCGTCFIYPSSQDWPLPRDMSVTLRFWLEIQILLRRNAVYLGVQLPESRRMMADSSSDASWQLRWIHDPWKRLEL